MAAWPRKAEVDAVVAVVRPRLAAAEVRRAVATFARPAVSGPLTVRVGSLPVRLQPARFASALSLRGMPEGRLEPAVDGARIVSMLRAAAPGVEKKPVDATVRLVGGRPAVVPAVVGTRYDAQAVAAAVLPALTSPGRTATTPGFDVTVTRGFRKDGKQVRTSQFSTHYIPEDDVRCTR